MLKKPRASSPRAAWRAWTTCSGPNAPVSAGQLEGALGGDLLGALAQQLGIGQQEVAGHLSQVLPQLVDGMTPDGQVPQGHAMPDVGQLDDLLGGLLGRR